MCFLVISRSGLFIIVYVKPHLLIFSNTSFRLYSHSTPTLSLCQSSTTTIHLYPTATFRPMLYTCSFFTTYLTLILYTFYQQPHTTNLPQLFNNHFWQHFRFFCNLSPANSQQPTQLLATSLPTAIFYFQASSTDFLLYFPPPPCFCWIRCAVCRPPILEGSYVEARLFRVLYT